MSSATTFSLSYVFTCYIVSGLALLVNCYAHRYFTKTVDFRPLDQTIMLIMMLAVRRCTIPLALLLALSFFVGATLAPAVLAGQVQVEQCCDKESVPEVPIKGGECNSECHCPSCQLVINTQTEHTELLTVSMSACSWLISKLVPSGFIRSIDYPPEHA